MICFDRTTPPHPEEQPVGLRLERWQRAPRLLPSFETLAALAPQDEVILFERTALCLSGEPMRARERVEQNGKQVGDDRHATNISGPKDFFKATLAGPGAGWLSGPVDKSPFRSSDPSIHLHLLAIRHSPYRRTPQLFQFRPQEYWPNNLYSGSPEMKRSVG
jgi:hypothetical protein